MSDEGTGARLNARERRVLSEISKHSVPREALKKLENSGCERELLVRLLNAAVFIRALREGRSATEEPWGLSGSALRRLPQGMRSLAGQIERLHESGLGKLDHLRGALEEHPATEKLPPDLRGMKDIMVGLVESLPAALKWYARYLDRARLYGKKNRSYALRVAAEGMESALSGYVRRRTGSPHWKELSALLTATYDSATNGEGLPGKRKAGDSSLLFDVENLRKRVADVNKEAAGIAGGRTAQITPEKSTTKKASGKSGTAKR